MKKFPNYIQREAKDCGPTCIKIISKHYGKTINTQQLRQLSETTREGSSLLGLSEAVESIGFHSLGAKIGVEDLKQAPMPCILHWQEQHYVVLYKIKKNKAYISDPAHGLVVLDMDIFLKGWIGKGATMESEGVVLLVEPTPKFYDSEFEEDKHFGFGFIFRYLFKYKAFIVQIIIGMLAGSLLQLLVPFLTKSVVDIGIENQDMGFVYLVLFAQLALFIGKAALDINRSWILLHLSTRINISLISDFFIKLMKLPISYFDTRMTGDLLQRINDHKRIEKILTTSSLSILFSMFNLLIYSGILASYSVSIFMIFLGGSVVYVAWVLFFFKKRKELDYKRFTETSTEQSTVIELINGMQEIKLHNAEKVMRWNWEHVQARLFKIATKNLSLEQTQSVGSNLINELKNMFITILSAALVIDGSISFGVMLAISYIVGQVNAPISQLISFLRDVQDAQISLDRLGEIHHMDEEEDPTKELLRELPAQKDMQLQGVFFRYKGGLDPVLKDITLTIPANKTTAIVGTSGSGKTTLMKLLLRFYEPDNGTISIGKTPLKSIAQQTWRHHSGTVMQEGYIFNDTIAKNIAIGESAIDTKKLSHAITMANIQEYVDDLPMGVNTKIGNEGVGLSTGQKQRLLIARAIYKAPSLLFFDEATSALDTNNEKIIMENLNQFFQNRTAVVIAHRLSTVRNAHQIVVLEKGEIVEIGTHEDLVAKKGNYYHLVKNQLELGN